MIIVPNPEALSLQEAAVAAAPHQVAEVAEAVAAEAAVLL